MTIGLRGRDCRSWPFVLLFPMVAIHGQDENNNIAMRQAVMVLEELARTCELGVVIVHDHRKRGPINDSGQMMRGASDLRNAAVSHISMKRIARDRISIDHDNRPGACGSSQGWKRATAGYGDV